MAKGAGVRFFLAGGKAFWGPWHWVRVQVTGAFKTGDCGDFPGGPVVEKSAFQFRGCGLMPGWGLRSHMLWGSVALLLQLLSPCPAMKILPAAAETWQSQMKGINKYIYTHFFFKDRWLSKGHLGQREEPANGQVGSLESIIEMSFLTHIKVWTLYSRQRKKKIQMNWFTK